MENKVMVVCIIVGFLGFLATVLSFAAEANRLKGSHIRDTAPSDCIYPRNPALLLTATAALVIAQTIINVMMTCCSCCRRGPCQCNCRWTALLCSVVSWITFVIAVFVLLMGALLNNSDYYCYLVKPGVFAAAAVLSLTTVVLGIVSYLAVHSAKKNRGDPRARSAGQPGIAMEQSRLPQQRSEDPVFVHEDTYMRRQIA